jgi:gluconolactonase
MTRGQCLELLLLLACALILLAGLSPARAAENPYALRLDPAIDAILPPDARVETLFARDSIFDGPTWVRTGNSGYLIFSDVPGNVIDKLRSDGRVSGFLQNIFAGRDVSQAYQSFGLDGQKRYRMLGADGVTLDRQGRVVYCAYSDGEIVRLETDGRRTVLASRFAGRRLNAPNDLVYKSDGALYFTDSRAGTKRIHGDGVPHEGLYALREGKVLLLSKSIDHPNGVAFSPGEKYLYVTNTLRKNILRFSVTAGGIANGSVFVDMSGVDEPGAPDGIKVDKAGNVYATGPGGVWVISPGGKHIGTIRTPAKVTNMTFGDPGFRTLYMTAFGALYRIRLKIAGR